VTIPAKYVLGLSRSLSGGQSEGQKLCESALDSAANAGDFGLHTRALLAAAEAALARNDAQRALSLALLAQTQSARGELYESEWRAWMIASLASEKLGNSVQSATQRTDASASRAKLEQQWGADAFKQYSSRPDIQVYVNKPG
jgi:hypothetical protein